MGGDAGEVRRGSMQCVVHTDDGQVARPATASATGASPADLRHVITSRPVRGLSIQAGRSRAGESRTLFFPIGSDERQYRNAAARDWVCETSTIDVW